MWNVTRCRKTHVSDCTSSTVYVKYPIVKRGHCVICRKSHQSYHDTLLVLYDKNHIVKSGHFLISMICQKNPPSMTPFKFYAMTHNHICRVHKKTDMKFTNMRYEQWSNHSLNGKKKWNRSIVALIVLKLWFPNQFHLLLTV